MKSFYLILLGCLSMLIFGCRTETISLKPLDAILSTKYYSTDIIPEDYQEIYGVWKVVGTSGGFAGNGFEKDFDFLLLKKNGIFGIVRHDTLIAYGKLTLLPQTEQNSTLGLYCNFEFDQNANIQLNNDTEKYIQLAGKDTLNLIAPCCDRYNIHFVRENVATGTLRGKISIGPLCPVETVPPRPECLPTEETYKQWQTTVWNRSKTIKICNINPDIDGNFEVTLSPGKYIVDFETPRSNGPIMTNMPLDVTIATNETISISIDIDTGIR